MTLVTVDLGKPEAEGVLPDDTRVGFQPTRRRYAGTTVVLPKAFSVVPVGGVAVVELSPTGADWCWRITEYAGQAGIIRHVAVPDADSADYVDLIDVDPATLAPAAEPVAAWWAVAEGMAVSGADAVEAAEAATAAKVSAEAARDTTVAALPSKQDKSTLDADVAAKASTPGTALATALSASIAAQVDAENAAKRAGLKLHADYVGTQREGAPGMIVGALLQYNSKSAAAVDLGTATLTVTGPHYVTTVAPHGLVVGERIRFGAGTLPATVSVGTNYYVMTVVSATVVQLYREGIPGTRLQWTTDGSAPLYKWPLATSFAASRDTGLLNPAFRFANAPAIQSSATAPYRDWAKANPAALTYAPGTLAGPSLTLETIITGKTVDLLLVNNIGYSTRIWVDGRLAITLTPTDFTTAGISASTGLGRLGISFTAKAQRKIGVEVMQGNVAGVEYLDAEPPLFPTDQRGARTMIQGDSFTEGGSAGLTGMPYVTWLQKLLGWNDVWRSGSGSTGYVTAGTRTALIGRWQNDIVAQAPDRLILAHGINDTVATSQAVATAAATIIDGTLAALPATEIVVVGPFSSKGKDYAPGYLADHDAALRDVAKARGLQFISPLGEEWITGNGNISAPTGNGNADVYISADGTHPTPAGHEYLGWRLAGHLSG